MGRFGCGEDVADMILLDVAISVFEDDRFCESDVFVMLTGLEMWSCSLLEDTMYNEVSLRMLVQLCGLCDVTS